MKISRNQIKRPNGYKGYYHNCEVCGRMIDDWEYRAYGKCSNCRWL